jgi:magnesium chelatase family protein
MELIRDKQISIEGKSKLSVMNTVAFNGIEVIEVQVQVSISQGMPAFIICGLPDKAVNESRDRIRSALASLGMALPARRIVVNMSPANIPKEGSHYDLPIMLGLLQALDVISPTAMSEYIALGEIALDSNLVPVPGVLIAAIHTQQKNKKLICPEKCASEAACGGSIEIIPARNLLDIIGYFKGRQSFSKPLPKQMERQDFGDMRDIVGNQSIKRVLEIAAAGGHHLLMIGSPGVGKSMCAKRLGSILPDLSIPEALEVSMIHSIAALTQNGLIMQRQVREPHHNASMASILGGGRDCKPGEISLAHRGLLFLDEITLWPSSILNGLRESLETGYISISRANAHVKYPAQYQLIAAMNPCPCGKAYDQDVKCSKLPDCANYYMK